jgi:hypothetical protein
VSANEDQSEESLNGGTLHSCDSHATFSGGVNCLAIFPVTESDKTVTASTEPAPIGPLVTCHSAVESSTP